MVCTGNICRSPTMEAVARTRTLELGIQLHLDSAGTTGWHEGEPPDPRTIEVGEAAGYSLANLRARKVSREDFLAFDLILAADRGHLRQLASMAPGDATCRLALFLGDKDLPDPYYGTREDFLAVLAVIQGRFAGWKGDLSAF